MTKYRYSILVELDEPEYPRHIADGLESKIKGAVAVTDLNYNTHTSSGYIDGRTYPVYPYDEKQVKRILSKENI